jgi:DNA-binding LacI/PurR family transcriptional regulator
MISPALTTIGKPKLEIGRMAAEIVLKMLAGVQVDPVTLLPAQLIIRETTRQREA